MIEITTEINPVISITTEINPVISITTEEKSYLSGMLFDNSGSMTVSFSEDGEFIIASIHGIWKNGEDDGILIFEKEFKYDNVDMDMCKYLDTNTIDEEMMVIYDSADEDNNCFIRDPMFDISSNNAGTYILVNNKFEREN